MLHLEETDQFDYIPPEKYVAEKLQSRSDPASQSRWYDFFPIRQALILRRTANARSAMVRVLALPACLLFFVVIVFAGMQVTSFVDMANRIDMLEDTLTKSQVAIQSGIQALSDKLGAGTAPQAAQN
jgi:hypothetical protein